MPNSVFTVGAVPQSRAFVYLPKAFQILFDLTFNSCEPVLVYPWR
jgi:hypothetical protein